MSIGKLLSVIVLVFILIRTTSYGIWTWKEKNKLGSIAILAVALCSIIIPVYKLFLGE